MLIRLLLSFAVVSLASFVWFHIGKWEERRRTDREMREACRLQRVALNERHQRERARLDALVAECRAELDRDAEALMRDMSSWAEWANCEEQRLVNTNWIGWS